MGRRQTAFSPFPSFLGVVARAPAEGARGSSLFSLSRLSFERRGGAKTKGTKGGVGGEDWKALDPRCSIVIAPHC